MIGPHYDGCNRGAWLLEQRATRKFWELLCDAFIGMGPPCTCPVSTEESAPPEEATVQG